MAKPSKTPETPKATTEESDLPTLTHLSMHKTGKGWVVLRIKTQGRKVLDEEVLSEGAVPRHEAENVLKVEVVKTFIFPRDTV